MEQVCVLGLGYIGLPTCVALASSGMQVAGVDVNPQLLDELRRGRAALEEPGLENMLDRIIREGCISFHPQPIPSDAFIIAVPTPLDSGRQADLSFVMQAFNSLLNCLRPGNLIIIESTVPPFYCREVLQPLLAEAGFMVGWDVFLAHCPERVVPGNIMREIVYNPRLIGGCTPRCTRRAEELYRHFVKGPIYLTDAATAEMTKLVENTYRDVNIALVNELALICCRVGLDVLEVVRLANHHPRVSLLNPGPGVGGHCLAVDPYFIVNQTPETARLIALAREINNAMPNFIVEIVRNMVENKASTKITLFGLSYKGNVGDLRESPALVVQAGLEKSGYTVAVYDPHVPGMGGSLPEAVQDSSMILILSDHQDFKDIDYDALSGLMARPLIFDTRDILRNMSETGGCQIYNLGNIGSFWRTLS